MLVVLGVRWRSSPVVRVALALMAVSALLSLGPTLLVGGRDTGIRLPWAFFEGLPLLPSLIPGRLAQLTALFAGLLVALFLHAVWRGGGWRRPAAAAVGLLVWASRPTTNGRSLMPLAVRGSMALLGPIRDDGGRPEEVRRHRRPRRHLATSSSTGTEVHDDVLNSTTPRAAAFGRG